jgi:hypothetical protein
MKLANPAAAAAGTAAATGTGTARHYFTLLQNLATRICHEATGSTLPTRTRITEADHDRPWLGMLASARQLEADAARGNTYGERLVPPAQGFTFRARRLPVELTFIVEAAAFLPLHPTVDEQRAAVAGADADGDGDGTPPIPAPAAIGRAAGQGHPLAPVWTKVAIDPVTVTLTLDEASPGAQRIGEEEIAAAFRTAMRPPGGASPLRPRRLAAPGGLLPRTDDMFDPVTWDRYTAENLVDLSDLVLPEMRAAIDIEVVAAERGYEILATVVNTTPDSGDQLFDGINPYPPGSIDLQLYEVVLTATTTAALVPYELEQVARSYRYDRTVEAFGHACPVDVTHDLSGPEPVTSLRTLFAARQQTRRVHPRTELVLPGASPVPIDTSFATLIGDPVSAVAALRDAHRAWVDHHWSTAELDRLQVALGWDSSAREEADKDAEVARAEVGWVDAGLALLRDNTTVRDAFVLANRTVAAAAAGQYQAWHPFQVAWIVGCLPGMVDPAAHREVDIVWFSTGGGKSEAYLGLMATTLFYGRLTGVTAGTQVWARFPLRLLALQQTERFASMVCHAEILRRGDPRTRAGDPFGVGYFVGGGNTPNRLYELGSRFSRGVDPADPSTAEACRVLESCPVCRGPLSVRFHQDSWTMQHICGNAGCAMAGVLPVWGIDDDIYRHAPSVLVGTVDKLAQLGQAAHFQVLLGRAASRCPQHGYTGSAQYCAVFGCQSSRQAIPGAFGHVRLEIADELHLLEESLGALDGMYETLLQAINAGLGHDPIQVVGATATIEGYQNQVQHLYQRPARRFPANGPVVGETFWSLTDDGDPLRSYLGVRPRGITMVTATREVALTHAAWLAALRDTPDLVLTEAGLDPLDSAAQDAASQAWRDLYEVLVAYCLRVEDLTSFIRDSAIQDLLSSRENLAIINGDAEPSAVRNAVRRLTSPPRDEADRVKMIAATKAIGHGFDVARLGVMVAMGTPTQAAEIIQASARVGRRMPGLVVNVINPTRDRDASVFRYYADWIRFLDRLVHKVPVNRESLPVLKRVLAGGLMAWLLQVHDRGWITGGRRRKSLANSVAFADAVRAGYLDRALLIDNLSKGFGLSATSVYHQMHRDAVTAWVDQQLTTLPLRAEADKRLPELLNPGVPRSLRDVEEPIVIYGNV